MTVPAHIPGQCHYLLKVCREIPDLLSNVPALLSRASVSMNLKECFFFEDGIENMGHGIRIVDLAY